MTVIPTARHLETGTSKVILGSESSTPATWPGRRVRDVSPEIALLDSGNTALLTLLMKLRKKSTHDPKFEWQEDVFPTQYVTVTDASASSGDTTFTVSAGDAALLRVGDVLWHAENDEVVFVSGISSTTITYVSVTSATTWSSADTLFYVGNAQEMGDTSRDQLTTIVTQPYNYTQLFKDAFEVSNTLNKTALFGGPDLVYQRRKHGEIHKKDMERAFWWGERKIVDSQDTGSYPLVSASYLTRGVWRWILDPDSGAGSHTNSGTLAEDDFATYLQDDFRYGNNVKFMFCSPLALTVISGWGRDKLETVPSDTTYGINITRYKSPHGELNLINSKLFGDIDGGASASYNPAECSITLDLEQLYYRYFRNTTLELSIQENDRDSIRDQYITECGLELHLPEHHSAIWEWSQ